MTHTGRGKEVKKKRKKILATAWLLLELNISLSRGNERQQNITELLISL